MGRPNKLSEAYILDLWGDGITMLTAILFINGLDLHGEDSNVNLLV